MLLPTSLDAPARRLSATLSAYFRLTKPRVVELLLVTALPPMVLAARGWPAWHLVFAVLVGGALAAGGANAINCWIERDRDHLMRRTVHRPLPSGDIEPGNALAFGIGLNVVAFIVLAAMANVLSACLTMAATLFYVFVYTIWLKPRSVQNIVIGGAAGAVPALVGWAAVTGRVSAPAWILFLVVFAWTPAHFWALALKYRDDYAAAGIPMLPVVKGVPATTRGIFRYAVFTVALTLTLGSATSVGWIYLGVASIAGAAFILGAIGLMRDGDPKRAIRFFGLSNVYLMLVFVAVAVDTLVFR
jgi:heme o synthase